MKSNNEVSAYLENISVLLLGALLFASPLIFTTLTTDAFVLPKQIFMGVIVLLLIILSGVKMISDKAVKVSKTPFDLPVLIFAGVLLVSSVLAVNRIDSITATIPVLLSVIIFYLVANIAKNKPSILFLISTLLLGATLAALVAIFSFFKVYPLPFAFSKVQYFTLFGSLLDQALYFTFALPVAGVLAWKGLKNAPLMRRNRPSETTSLTGSFLSGASFLAIAFGLGVTVYQLATTQRPLLLPFETGFQLAFASISQDAGRIAQGFLFGSGYGTFYADFMRFKQAAFNLNQNLWAFTFFRSSSFVLELLATTGILGFLSFGFVLFKVVTEAKTSFIERKKTTGNPLTLSLLLALVGALLLPFSPLLVTSFFILLGLFAASERLIEGTDAQARYFDVELHFVAFKKGILPLATSPIGTHPRFTATEQSMTKFLPVSLLIVFLLFSTLLGFQLYQYTASDVMFQHSLLSASQNNGLQTYLDQSTAIKMFPYRDAYYRIASQTDLALANALAASVPQGSSPSGQIQQNVSTLIQQSITNARTATDLGPQNAINWQNLSSVYRSLIGFGQNAEQFAVSTQQQAIALNPSDPQGYVNLGGIFYQLKLWDQAQQQFQLAVNLKSDYSNAYYNLGHALEEKGDYQNALLAYQAVRSLVAADKENVKKIDQDIAALQQRAGQAAAAAQGQTQAQPAADQQPLGINQSQTQLPAQNPPVKIPAPQASPTPTPKPTEAASPTPTTAEQATVTPTPAP